METANSWDRYGYAFNVVTEWHIYDRYFYVFG